MAKLVRNPIDVVAMIAAAGRSDCGALVTFLGTTRESHAGRRVARLE